MIYIGDGETDVPAMKMITDQGGTSIAVFDKKKKRKGSSPSGKEICVQLVVDGRAHFMAPADYRLTSSLVEIVQLTIKKIVATEALAKLKSDATTMRRASAVSKNQQVTIKAPADQNENE